MAYPGWRERADAGLWGGYSKALEALAVRPLVTLLDIRLTLATGK
jgi:hypothetical protein